MILDLGILVGVILNQYFNETRCILQIGEMQYLFAIDNYPMYIFTTDANLSLGKINYKPSQRCQGFALSSGKPSELLEKLELFLHRKTEVRYNNRKYIFFLPNGDMSWMANSSALWHISNTVLIKYLEKGQQIKASHMELERNGLFELYTHRYIGLNHNNDPVLLDIWFSHNKSFLYNNNLFPDKIRNQFGRTLKVITADYLPYTHWESKSGMELITVLEYSSKYNVTLNVTITDLWGKIFKNWTGTGILGSISMGLFDIGFSALFAQPDRILYSDFSSPTAFSQVSCVVPAPQLEEGWFTHIKVFNLPMWILVISSYSCLGLTVYITKTLWCSRETNTTYFTPLSLIGIFVSHPIPKTQVPSIVRLRYVFALVLILTVMLSTMYNSRLSSILVAPIYVNEIKTVDDLAKSGILWGELQDDWVIPLNVDERPIYKIIKNKFRVESDESLRELSLKNNFAFGTERLLSGYYAIGGYFREDVVDKFVVMTDDLYRQYTCMQLRKSSILLPSINKFLIQVTETGLLNYWEGQTSMQHTDYRVQKGLMIKSKQEHLVSLQVKHIKGVFLLWFIGLFISFLKFLHEIEKGKIAKKRLKNKPAANILNTVATRKRKKLGHKTPIIKVLQ